jgi:prepilin-type N-terminal cleavage/methylation domain-containing protein
MNGRMKQVSWLFWRPYSSEKTQLMNLKNRNGRNGQFGRLGFTLIEIIGVLAVIAVLAALLTPKVFEVIARGKINSTALGYNTVRTAVTDYFAQNGAFPVRDGTGSTNAAVATGRFDADLVAGGFLDKMFSCAIGWQTNSGGVALTGRTHVRSLTGVSAAVVTAPTATTGGDNFDLDRNSGTSDFTTQNIVSLFIPGVALTDAIALNKIIDGDENSGTGADIVGRCIYSAPVNGLVTAYVYVAHY